MLDQSHSLFHVKCIRGYLNMNKQEKAMKLIEEQQYEEAAQLFIEHIEEEPNDPVRYINFASFLLQMKQDEQAERFFLKAIELDEKAATAYYGLGNIYYEHELFDEAEKVYLHSIRLGMDDADVYYILGMTYVKKENMTLSLPYLQRATELSNDADMLFQYGLVLAKSDYLKEAETVLHRVVKQEEKHADAWYNLGIIAVQNDQFEMAIHYFEQVLEHQPEHLLAKEAMKKVKNQIVND